MEAYALGTTKDNTVYNDQRDIYTQRAVRVLGVYALYKQLHNRYQRCNDNNVCRNTYTDPE